MQLNPRCGWREEDRNQGSTEGRIWLKQNQKQRELQPNSDSQTNNKTFNLDFLLTLVPGSNTPLCANIRLTWENVQAGRLRSSAHCCSLWGQTFIASCHIFDSETTVWTNTILITQVRYFFKIMLSWQQQFGNNSLSIVSNRLDFFVCFKISVMCEIHLPWLGKIWNKKNKKEFSE